MQSAASALDWGKVRDSFETTARGRGLYNLNRCGYSDDLNDDYADSDVQAAWSWVRDTVVEMHG